MNLRVSDYLHFARVLICTTAATVTLIGSALPTQGADWRQWRGEGREDHSPDTGLLKSWPKEGPRRLWLFENAGLGYGGYSLADNRLFTVGLREDKEFLIAVDSEKGTEVWSAFLGPKYSNGWGDGPRMTPTVEGDRVYAIGGNGLLVCTQIADGKVLWQKSLVSDLGGVRQNWGFTESPLIVGDQIFCTPGGPRGTLAALNKTTGEVLWRTTDLTDAAQYSSPILVNHGGKSQVVQLVERKFFGVDPSNGKVLWTSDFPGKVAVIPTPIHHNGIVFVTAGYSVGCKAIRLGSSQNPEMLYKNNVMKNHHGGVVRVEQNLYGYSDGSGWVCQDLKTGKEVWANKSLGKGSVHYADGMLYCVEEDSGTVALVEASPTGWKETSRFKLSPQSERRHPQGKVWTHPVVVNGRLYLRDQELLYCYEVKGK